MLILTRRLGEKVFINDDITVQVLEMGGGFVRLGIIAPKNIVLEREEKVEKMLNRQNRKLSTLAPLL